MMRDDAIISTKDEIQRVARLSLELFLLLKESTDFIDLRVSDGHLHLVSLSSWPVTATPHACTHCSLCFPAAITCLLQALYKLRNLRQITIGSDRYSTLR